MADEGAGTGGEIGPDMLLVEILVLADQKAAALAERLRSPAGSGVTDLVDFLCLLQINRSLVELRHLQSIPDLHSERLFLALLQLASDLETLGGRDHSVAGFPVYDAANPSSSFCNLGALLRSHLSAVMQVRARPVPLQERNYGIRTAEIGMDLAADGTQKLVLMASSTMPADALRARLPSQVKIGPPQALRDLVNSQLPGLALRALPTAPRQLPFLAGASYFEVELGTGPLAQKVRADGHLALHVAGDFPELQLNLWIVEDDR